MAAEHAAVEMDDLAGLARRRASGARSRRCSALRHEADVLAVGLVGDREAELAGERAGLALGQLAQREAQQVELLRRRGVEEIALVALRIGGPVEGAAAVRQAPRLAT